jgi:hypothetical protein
MALLAAVLSAAAMAEPSNIRPGLWEITTEMDMPGMPVQMPPQTTRHCYTAADLAEAENAIPQAAEGHCTVTDYRVEGDTATWAMQCSGDTPMQATGSMTSSAERYSGEMQSVMQGPGGQMRMTTRWHGRRIGDCP